MACSSWPKVLRAYSTQGKSKLRTIPGVIGSTKPSKSSANAFEQALVGEKQRLEDESTQSFRRSIEKDELRQRHQIFPRTLKDGTFFTPHLTARQGPSKLPIEYEYAVVLPGQSVLVRQPYNPLRTPMTSIPPDILPKGIESKLHSLENKGWRFIGLNGDILVFERQFNYRQDSTKLAYRGAITLSIGVIGLTGILYLGEYLTSKTGSAFG